MKVNENIWNWYHNGGKEKIAEYMIDVDGIFTTEKGYKEGVYGVSVFTPEAKEILVGVLIGCSSFFDNKAVFCPKP